MTNRLMILGLDGAGFDHVKGLVDAGLLPNIKALADAGSFGPLTSTVPPITGPAWLTLATGLDVDQTGVPDFLLRSGNGFELRPVSSRDYRGRTFWDALSAEGARVAIFNFPLLYPPYAIEGVMVSGFGTDEATQWTYPESLKSELLDAVGPDYGLTVNYHHEIYNDVERFLDDLETSLDRRLRAAEFVCRKGPWDVFFCVLSEIDWMLHRCWADLDPDSPAHIPERAARVVERARNIWIRVDSAVPRLLEAMGADASVLICSDHGFGRNTRTIRINALLEQSGLLVRRTDASRGRAAIVRAGAAAAQRAGVAAARVRGPVGRLLERVRRRGRRLLPKDDSGYLLSTIDVAASTAFDPGHTIPFAGLYIGPRFERGGSEYQQALSRVEDAIRAQAGPVGIALDMRRPWFDSPHHVHSLPDLLVSADDWGASFSKTEFAAPYVIDGPFSPRHTGSHRMAGLYIGSGPAFGPRERGEPASILDVFQTVLALAGLAAPDDRRGRPLPSARVQTARKPARLDAETGALPAGPRDEDADVRERLKGLGYLE